MSLRRSRSRFACCALSAAWLTLLSACSQDTTKLTQIVVVVDSDLSVPAELDGLHIEVTGTKPMRVIDAPLDADHKLPRTLGIVYSGGQLGPLRVLARGTLAGETVVERLAEVRFKKDRTLKLAMPLTRQCTEQKKPTCEADQTCDQGKCAPVAVASLPAFDGNDGSFLMDAGTIVDAGPDADSAAAVSDTGTTYDSDADTDAGPSEGSADAGAGDGITCTITQPADGDTFYEGDELTLAGSCIGRDGSAVGVRWRSSLDGSLSTKKIQKKALSVGMHELSLCANGTTACASPIQISVQALPELTAMITTLAQAGATADVYRAGAELVVKGTGTGVLPLKLMWIDSLAGEVATGETCRFAAPVLAGRHMLRLVVTDARGRMTSAEHGFIVHATGRDALFESFGVANSLLGSFGTVTALASDGPYHYVGTENGYVLQVSADLAQMISPTVTSTSLTTPRPAVRDLFVHVSSNTLYVATIADVQACSIANATLSSCAKLALGPGFAPAVPRSVRRITNEAADYLAVGTSLGLWVGQLGMLDKGNMRQNNAVFNAMTESAGKLWLASSTGLFAYTLGSGGGVAGSPEKLDGASGGLNAMVASSDTLWATLSNGFTRYQAAEESWSTWTTAYTQAVFGRLVSNDIRSIAITHPVIDDVAHDVIWLATASGLSRFDPAIPSFTTYTTVDGLPDTAVLRVLGLSSNELLLATPSGLAIHRGQ